MSPYDDLLVEVTSNGRYQYFIILVVLLQAIIGSFLNTSSVFLLGLPPSRCNIPAAHNFSVFANESFLLETYIPRDNSTKDYSRCAQYAGYDLQMCNENDTRRCVEQAVALHSRKVVPCTDGYHFDRSAYKETATTEWSLVCDKLYLMTIGSSAHYTGLLFGAIAGGMAGDRFGRVLVCRLAALLCFACCLGLAFSPSIIVLVPMRFIVAFCRNAGAVCSFVFACEVSKKSVRPCLGSGLNFIFGVGCIIFAGMAYVWRDWRELSIAISVAVLLLGTPLMLLPESPGWLLSRGKEKDAARVCRLMAKRNKGTVSEKTFANACNASKEQETKVGLGEMMRRPLLRFMLFSNAAVWFITSLVYYGVTLNVGSLAGSVYANQALGGLMEAVACLAAIPMITRLGRRYTTVLSLAVSSASCLLSTAIIQLGGRNHSAETAGVVVAMIGRFSSSAAFAVIYQHTGEMFPTPGRATALGFASMAARIGSIFTPFTLQLQYSWPWMTPTIYGILSALGASLAMVFPETNKKPVLTTFQQADIFFGAHFRRSIATRIFCLPKANEKIQGCEQDVEEATELGKLSGEIKEK